MISIGNEELNISIHEKGAELCSVFRKSDQTEYLWQADPHHWGRHAPVLFPIVGRLKNDQYFVEGKAYSMGQHGFARDRLFEVIKNGEDEAIFLLTSDEETLNMYPFNFSLTIGYRLESGKIIISYEVENENTFDMPFSIGAHPAFRCPIKDGERRSDFRLVFNQKEVINTQRLENGLRTGESENMLDNENILIIKEDLFDHDALIFSGLKSNEVCLQTSEKEYLSFDYTGFPFLGIWSKSRDSPFLCIEPWMGIADSVHHHQILNEKEGIIILPAGQTHHCAFSFTIL